MQCEEFRQLMLASEGNEGELEKHLESCPACDAWLQKELATPPEGLTPAQWHDATARCFPEQVPAVKAPEAEAEAETFWTFFFNGLKYGMVFGLSIVAGFAILEHLQGPAKNLPQPQEVKLVSFVEPSETALPDFFEKPGFDVTFYENGDSKIVSFLPKVQMQSFYETTEEEETWNENQG